MKSALKRIFLVHPGNYENDALKSVSLNQKEVYYSKKEYVKMKNKNETPFLNPPNTKGLNFLIHYF